MRGIVGWYLLLGGCFNHPAVVNNPSVGVDYTACREPEFVTVSCVVDGDTFDIGGCGEEAVERFRLLGINAPETSSDECFSGQATDELSGLIEGGGVWVTFDKECEGVFGRTLAYVWTLTEREVYEEAAEDVDTIDDVRDMEREFTRFTSRDRTRWVENAGGDINFVNSRLLANGFVRQYENESLQGDIRYLETFDAKAGLAMERGVGLWGECQ